jgi:hypothetical protein
MMLKAVDIGTLHVGTNAMIANQKRNELETLLDIN